MSGESARIFARTAGRRAGGLASSQIMDLYITPVVLYYWDRILAEMGRLCLDEAEGKGARQVLRRKPGTKE